MVKYGGMSIQRKSNRRRRRKRKKTRRKRKKKTRNKSGGREKSQSHKELDKRVAKERNERKEREREESATDRWAAKNIQRIVRGNRGRNEAAEAIRLKNLRERLEILKAKAAAEEASRMERLARGKLAYQVRIPENVKKEDIARGLSLQFTGNGGQTYTVKIPTDKKPGEIFIASVRPKW